MNTATHKEYEADVAIDAIRAQLAAVLGDARLATGLSIAHALTDIFLSEVRQKGLNVAEEAWKVLDEAAIKNMGEKLEQLITTGGADCPLPAGTAMMGRMSGTIFVDAESFGLDVDHPGLHLIEDLSDRPGGSNFDLLLDTIRELSDGLPCSAIGMPTMVERVHERHLSYRFQFPPFATAGGVVLQRSLDFPSWGEYLCSYSRSEVLDFAANIVSDMCQVWENGSKIGERVRKAWRAANRIASGLPDVVVKLVTIEPNSGWTGHNMILGVEFEAWDHSLRRGIVIKELGFEEEAEKALNSDGLDRKDEVRQVHAIGAHGRIEGLARAIANAAPQGARSVLAELSNSFETSFVVTTDTGLLRCRLYWWRGVICADAEGSKGVRCASTSITCWRYSFPQSVVTALRGKPLSVVFDGPFQCESRIEKAELDAMGLRLEIEPDRWLVNCATGQTWREKPNENCY